MQKTKTIKNKKLCSMAIILAIVIAVLVISCSGIATAQATATENSIGHEQKIYSTVDIDDDFDDSCVMVVMDKFSSGFNKSHTGLFSNKRFVKSIKDLTKLTGDILSKKYLNRDDFRQILKIDLKEHSKQNVLDAISQIQKLDGVLWAGVSVDREPLDMPSEVPNAMSGTNYKLQWALGEYQYGINALGSWQYTVGSTGVKVGIIDSGIADHEDLNSNVKKGWNFIDDSEDTSDTHGHGTAIAGIIGATGTNANGVVGVNWEVSMIPLKVDYFDTQLNKVRFNGSAIVDAINWAIDNNVDILNASYGSDTENVAEKMAMNNFNGLIVCSAGNDNNDNDTQKHYPSAYSQGEEFGNRVISVGALAYIGEKASFSNYGAETVDLFAPGEGIMTTAPLEVAASGYKVWDGTSFAAPYVVGVAALLFARYNYYKNYVNKDSVAISIKSTILNYVTKDDLYSGKCVTGGRLNAYETLKHCKFIPNIMSGYGYNDGWYYWEGKVDMHITTLDAYDYNEDGEVVLKKMSRVYIGVTKESGFNAVSKMYLDMKFVLTNSSGEIVFKKSYSTTFGIFSNSAEGYYMFEVPSSVFETNDRYTITWKCESTRKNRTDSCTSSYSFIVDIDS